MFEVPPRYRSYLLILWEERGRESSTHVEWRFRLEDPHTSKRVGFVNLDDLLEFLQQQTGTLTGTEGGYREGR